MPVIRPGQALATLKTHLIDLLVKELMGRTTRDGPVIFEDPVGPGEINVIVVWEAWGRLSQDDRVAAIREAYSRYSRTLEKGTRHGVSSEEPDPPMVPKVLMTIGATWNEAVELNLLPFFIYSSFDPKDVDSLGVQAIMIDSGAIESPTGLQLRFPNDTLAREIQARLAEEMPEVRWYVGRDVQQADDWSGT